MLREDWEEWQFESEEEVSDGSGGWIEVSSDEDGAIEISDSEDDEAKPSVPPQANLSTSVLVTSKVFQFLSVLRFRSSLLPIWRNSKN